VVQPVLRSKTNEVVVDRGLEQQAVERQPGRSAPVHRCTGTLGVMWLYRLDWKTGRATAFITAGDDVAGATVHNTIINFTDKYYSIHDARIF